MSLGRNRLERLKAAMAEVLAARQSFTEDSFNELILSLNTQINALQSSITDTLVPMGDSDEIRLVTVMFVDVEDSTRLAQVLDDDWKTMIGDLHKQIARIVEQWDGEVGQYLGDGVLCFFGAHRSRDNDAARAVSCALSIQQMADDFALYVTQHYEQKFALRIGISTGRVVVGVIGTASKSEFVALGSTTNLAARLQQLCPPRHVLIDAQTYHRVRDRFVAQAQPPAALKGFDTLIEYYAVLGRRQPAALLTDERIAGIELPFVGRDQELNHLLRLWDDALAERQLHVVVIYGDTGAGKTRLLQEALAQVPDRFESLILVGRYERRATSYSLVHDLLVGLCNLSDGAPPAIAEPRIIHYMEDVIGGEDAAAIAADVGHLAGFGFADHPSQSDPHEAVARWFRALASDRPLLITVDNLQWADPGSLDLLEYLAVALVDTSGVIFATARSDFRLGRSNFMSLAARYSEMSLGRLGDVAISKLIEVVLERIDNAPLVLADYIRERSEGNPLFVEEFLHMLFDNGVFEPTNNGRWRTNLYLYGTLASTLPNGLMGVFQARLDELPPLARRVVQMAAVIGETFWEEAISHLGGFESGPILVDLTTRGIVLHSAESSLEGQVEYRFRHPLYSEVAYGMLTRIDREAYHQRTAEWIASHVLDRPDLLGVLAEHLVQAQKREQALSVFLVAAEDRLQRGLAPDTLKLIESGLASARDVPRAVALPLVSQLWMRQGQALMMLGRYAEASAAGQTALMLMDELPPDTLVDERERARQVLADAREHTPRSN